MPEPGEPDDVVFMTMTLDGSIGVLMHTDGYDTSVGGGSFGANNNIGIAILQP